MATINTDLMNRTEAQNKYYFKCIVLELCKHTGYHKYEMHEILKDMFIPDTTRELTTEEFNMYCEQIRIWSQQELGVFLEEPKIK